MEKLKGLDSITHFSEVRQRIIVTIVTVVTIVTYVTVVTMAGILTDV